MGGEFADWLLRSWSEIVAATARDRESHRIRGADVAVMFWSDEVESKTDRTVVAQYLAREAGKWRQKQPPPGFTKVGRFYGIWGKSVGFRPETSTILLDPNVAAEVEERLARWINWKLHVLRQGAPAVNGLTKRRPRDGITAFGLGPAQAERILVWSEKAAARRRAKGLERGAGAAGPGDLVALLNSVDLTTVEIVSPNPGLKRRGE